MANSGSGNGGPTGSGHGNREQFDLLDRFSKVSQVDLNADKMKAGDKEADVEELLATEDETNIITEELDGAASPTTAHDLNLETYTNDVNAPIPIDEINSTKSSNQPTAEAEEEADINQLLDTSIQSNPETTDQTILTFESPSNNLTIEDDTLPISSDEPPVPEILEEDDDVPVDDELPEPPEAPTPPGPPEPPEPPTPPEP
ncbi:MAG: hypothetical protein NWP91_05930, partial [Rickettsiaceae bacterium]|nr:hypothetical protein [Rickettsiaceae bacterium]MDP5083763.1 hypothetical protein [Rickettsiaceae bacterium]